MQLESQYCSVHPFFPKRFMMEMVSAARMKYHSTVYQGSVPKKKPQERLRPKRETFPKQCSGRFGPSEMTPASYANLSRAATFPEPHTDQSITLTESKRAINIMHWQSYAAAICCCHQSCISNQSYALAIICCCWYDLGMSCASCAQHGTQSVCCAFLLPLLSLIHI